MQPFYSFNFEPMLSNFLIIKSDEIEDTFNNYFQLFKNYHPDECPD